MNHQQNAAQHAQWYEKTSLSFQEAMEEEERRRKVGDPPLMVCYPSLRLSQPFYDLVSSNFLADKFGKTDSIVFLLVHDELFFV